AAVTGVVAAMVSVPVLLPVIALHRAPWLERPGSLAWQCTRLRFRRLVALVVLAGAAVLGAVPGAYGYRPSVFDGGRADVPDVKALVADALLAGAAAWALLIIARD